MSRHEDHVRQGIELHDSLQHLHTAHTGHDQIGEHNLRMLIINKIETSFRIGCHGDIKTLLGQRAREKIEATGVVIDDDERYGRRRLHGKRRAVSAIVGRSSKRASLRIASSAPNPTRAGICRSSIIRSGLSCSVIRTASALLPASLAAYPTFL